MTFLAFRLTSEPVQNRLASECDQGKLFALHWRHHCRVKQRRARLMKRQPVVVALITGLVLTAGAEALRRAGAREVVGLVVAVAGDRPRRSGLSSGGRSSAAH